MPSAPPGAYGKDADRPRPVRQFVKKGYQARPCGSHIEGGYCCPQALWEFHSDFKDCPEVLEGWMLSFLELERREVFRCWYGETKWDDPRPDWKSHLLEANCHYRDGKIAYCVEHLRKP